MAAPESHPMDDASDGIAFWIFGAPLVVPFVIAVGSWVFGLAEMVTTYLLGFGFTVFRSSLVRGREDAKVMADEVVSHLRGELRS
jgi:hypothetical protein